MLHFNFNAVVEKLSVHSNHPVHILDDEGELSPSAFIPFCKFGNQNLGIYLKQFDQPICNIFQKKIIKDQLCYEANLNVSWDMHGFSEENNIGLSFMVDTNKDRQLSFDKDISKSNDEEITFGTNVFHFHKYSFLIFNPSEQFSREE